MKNELGGEFILGEPHALPEPSDTFIIWKLPYDPPQDSLGYFTFEEAEKLLETNMEQLESELDSSGFCNVNGYHVEWDE